LAPQKEVENVHVGRTTFTFRKLNSQPASYTKGCSHSNSAHLILGCGCFIEQHPPPFITNKSQKGGIKLPFKIAVCIKSVPSPDEYDKMTIDPETMSLVRAGISSVVNSADKHAVELALTIKEKHGGEVTVVSMGPPDAKEQLYEMLALGADKAALLCDKKFAGADTLATSYSLSLLLKNLGDFDLILAGNESDDSGTAHVPSQLGEWMDIPHIANVVSAELEGEKYLIAEKELEDGTAVYKLTLPCVAAVKKKINTVRFATMGGLFSAKSKPLTILGADDLKDLNEEYIGLTGSPTQGGEMRTVHQGRNSQAIEGTEEEIAAVILDKINALI